MNSLFKEVFGSARATLPLGKIRTVHCANATRIDWLSVCPARDDGETFVCGNPPYLGALAQSKAQRADVISVFAPILRGDTKVDYVSCWFIKLSDYIVATRNASGALVSTNSVCQGEQVSLLWPYIFASGLSIVFAHTSFKWENSASHNAGVTCIIVGLGLTTGKSRRLFTGDYEINVPSITAYLVPGPQRLIVESTTAPLNGLPEPVTGSEPKDGGNLIFSPEQATSLLTSHPEAAALLRPFYSAEDVLYGTQRYTLWIADDQLPLAESIPEVAERLRRTRLNRLSGGRDKKRTANVPHRYVYNRHKELAAIVIPGVSSERRPYLQVALMAPEAIVTHALIVVYSPPPYLFSVLSSRIHRVWAQTVGGKLEDRLRYSGNFVYNTFPIPALSNEQKGTLADYSKRILKTRARHAGKSLAILYNPETIPADLLAVHQELDEYLEVSIYGKHFKDDTRRLEHLFSMYARLREASTSDGSLFASEAQVV